MNKSVAVIGACGFVGSQLVEHLASTGETQVRAIGRNPHKLELLSCGTGTVTKHVADAQRPRSLQTAIAGADVVINLVTGSPSTIRRSTRTLYRACVAANVSRLVHLSSAVVYGAVESPLINDDSPPIRGHWMPYARAKAAAERELHAQFGKGDLQITVLRPGIVWGPHSPHILEIARSLCQKRAFLVNDGEGIFNSIFIANLRTVLMSARTMLPTLLVSSTWEIVRQFAGSIFTMLSLKCWISIWHVSTACRRIVCHSRHEICSTVSRPCQL